MPDWDVGRKSCQRPRIEIGFYHDPRKTTLRHWTGLFPNIGVYVLSPDSGELTGFCRFPWSDSKRLETDIDWRPTSIDYGVY